MNLKFSTKVLDVDVNQIKHYFGLKDSPNLYFEVEKQPASVSYEMAFEVREWGIKSVDVSILSFSTTIYWEVYKEDALKHEQELLLSKGGVEIDDCIRGHFDIVYQSGTQSDWEIVNEVTFSKSGFFSISDIEINLNDKKIFFHD